MRYTTEIERSMVTQYAANPCLATVSSLALQYDKPERSIISKLSSMGVYKRKSYTNKLGGPVIKKETYIERISALLDVDTVLLESLEKATKYALILMEKKIVLLNNSKNCIEKQF